jgi:hypothetical protein
MRAARAAERLAVLHCGAVVHWNTGGRLRQNKRRCGPACPSTQHHPYLHILSNNSAGFDQMSLRY